MRWTERRLLLRSRNFSPCVAHTPWLRRRASPLHCRARITKIGELFDASSCSDTPTSIYDKLREIERTLLPTSGHRRSLLPSSPAALRSTTSATTLAKGRQCLFPYAVHVIVPRLSLLQP